MLHSVPMEFATATPVATCRHGTAQLCRSCGAALEPFVDLGWSPLCEGFLTAEECDAALTFYPLNVRICTNCWLGQVPEFVAPEAIFSDYAYFSSYSRAWLEHAKAYATEMVERFNLDSVSHVVEIASNDGYLLRNFVDFGIPCLGIEPAANVAQAAVALGVPTLVKFFGLVLGKQLAQEGRGADLVVCNNVLAQVPDLNDFVAGVAALLRSDGVFTMEFPHLQRLIEENQFDTIYHEHFSYFSLASIETLLRRHGLRVFDVQGLWTHGGSLRVFACHAAACHREHAGVERFRQAEQAGGLQQLATYQAFQTKVEQTKHALLSLLIDLRASGKRVVGYGAPGKGNTLLNYCGIRTDLLEFTVDRNPHKHGKFLPGTGIPILATDAIEQSRPDYVLILPWNLRQEIMTQLAYIRDWGGRFIVPIPEATILD